jgi:hypothetical protein
MNLTKKEKIVLLKALDLFIHKENDVSFISNIIQKIRKCSTNNKRKMYSKHYDQEDFDTDVDWLLNGFDKSEQEVKDFIKFLRCRE